MIISQKHILLYLLFILTFHTLGAKNVSTDEAMDNFTNQELMNDVFRKLYNLEKSKKGKLNVVHIGDSHIQADIFTNTIREALQGQFGNGGLGFTFPYSLIGTNGSRYVKYVSNAKWESLLNVYPVADLGVGLSGIALYTTSSDFVIQLTADMHYGFNTIKVVYPNKESHFNISVSSEPLKILSTTNASSSSSGFKYYTVKKGEGLLSIAKKNRTTVAQIQKYNKIKGSTIHPGQKLKIPTKTASKSKSKVSNIKMNDVDLNFVELVEKPYYSTYVSDTLLNRVTIHSEGKIPRYNLNGFIIENNKPGVVYSAIGVNGAKLSDYNKYPLFFKQLPILEPDLIVLSFGTNESFGKLSASQYIYQMKEFIKNIKRECGNDVTILVMTPPPSLFRKSRPNPFVTDYAMSLIELSSVPVWDLYSRMGGLAGIKGEYSNLIGRDNVHYTHKGYKIQGEMFANDFIDAYNNYKKKQRN